jgi:hypothetical protein
VASACDGSYALAWMLPAASGADAPSPPHPAEIAIEAAAA